MTNTAVPTVQADNDRTRITRWDFAPGTATGWHRHEYDYAVVPLMDGALKLVDGQGNETIAELKAGVSYFRQAGVEHDVINPNDHPYAFVEIEFK